MRIFISGLFNQNGHVPKRQKALRKTLTEYTKLIEKRMYDRNIATPANHSMSNHFSTNTEHKRRRRCWNYPNAFIHLSHILYECTASLVHTTDIHYTKVYTEQVCNMLFYVSVLRIPNTKHRRNSPAFVILLISYQVFPVVSLALVFVQTPLSYARFFFFFSSRFCFKWYRSIRR